MKYYLVILMILLLVGCAPGGCTPIGKAGGAFTEICIAPTPSTSEIDLSRFAGQDVVIRFNHMACASNCDIQKVYLDDIEFLDENGNVIILEELDEFSFSQGDILVAKDKIAQTLSTRGITNFQIYPLKNKVVFEYFDSGADDENRLKIDTALIMAATLNELSYAKFIEVHHFKGM